MIANFTIYGERCSGTNYLEECVKANFNVNYVTKYGHKHFFGFSDLSNSDDTLFICIVRDPLKWINSFYRVSNHLIDVNCHSIDNFLTNPIVSFEKNPISLNGQKDQGKELETDRNIFTKEPYKNIFELRHVKNKYLLEVLPTLVDHCIFIRYEDLMDNFEKTMNAIRAKGLVPLSSATNSFPIKIDTTKPIKCWMNLGKKQDEIDADKILNHSNFIKKYDYQLGYLADDINNDADASHFTFIQGKSQINHDLKQDVTINNSQLSRNDKINKYMKSARDNADCAGFSTLGYYKSHINMLTDFKFFNKTNDGTYIKKIYSDGMYICGCVKNCGKFLKKVLENLHFLSAFFYHYEIIIAYDESTDNSLEILKNMSKVMNLTILYNHNTSEIRVENISNARNSILDYIRAQTEKKNFKYFVMVDMDDVSAAPLNMNVLHKYLKDPEKWDALSFNQKEYYDIWALSVDDYVCSCWHFEINPKNKAVEVMRKYITNKLNNALCENKLVECVSAFNGFGVYKTDVFIGSKYQSDIRTTLKLISAAQIRKNEQAMQSRFNVTSGHSMCDCEHRYFHLNAKRLNPNIKICISPLCLFGDDVDDLAHITGSIKEAPLLNSEEHCEYVSSWGLLKSCDITPLTHNTAFDLTCPNSTSKPTVIFMESAKLHNLVKIINKVQTRIILVTGDSDATIPGDLFTSHKDFLQFIENDKIVHWFSQNCTATHAKLSPMPIGMDYHTRINTTRWGPKVSPLNQEIQLKEIRNKAKPFWEREYKCYSNHHFSTTTRYGKIDRTSAVKEIPKELVFYEPENNKKDRHISWEKQINFGFVVSPLGNGYDCHRTWEALILGCIVVMKHNAIDQLFADLPVLLVDEWNQVTQELLDATVKEYRNKTFCYKKLTLKYWTDLIKSHQMTK